MNRNMYNNMNMVKPTYDQFIIKPPSKNETQGRISDIYVIDSRNRDVILYPKSCNYRLKIDDDYKDVISVELIQAQIPNTGYNINNTNNQLLFEDSSNNPIIIKLENGEYTNESLIKYLNGSKGNIFYNFVSNNQYFNFYVDKDTNLLRIQSNKEFNFNNIDIRKNEKTSNILNNCNKMNIDDYFKSINFNSIDKTLGFYRKGYSSNINNNKSACNIFDCSYNLILTGVIEKSPDTIYDLSYVEIITDASNNCDLRSKYNIGDYITINGNVYQIINIKNNNTMDIIYINHTNIPSNTNTIESDYSIYAENVFELECPGYVILDIPQFHLIESEISSIRDAFTIIPLNEKCKTIIDNTHSENKRKKYFNPPLARLSNIDIRFKRYDGSFYDFNGKNHMLALKISCLNQPGRYNDYN